MKANQTTQNPPLRRITTRIPRKSLRVFEFYAKHYEIPVLRLIQSEVYGQATCMVDDVFGSLEHLDSLPCEGEGEEIQLEFCPDVMALLSRISRLLRRPLDELIPGLLSVSCNTLSCRIQDALKGDGMFSGDMGDCADHAIDFARRSKQNNAPGWAGVQNGWDAFNLKKPVAR